MPVSLDYGLNINPVEEQEGVPLNYGLTSEKKQGVPLDYGLKIEIPKKPSGAGGSFEKPWGERLALSHPNLYAGIGAATETAKELTKFGHLKYLYPEEREKLTQLPPQQQTRQLLTDTLEDVGGLAAGPIMRGVGQVAKKVMPPVYKAFTTPMGKPRVKAVMEGGRVKLKQEPPKPTEVKGKEPWERELTYYNGGGNLDAKTGIYFTPDKKLAESFAEGRGAFREAELGKFDVNKKSTKLTEATLDIKNPKRVAKEGFEKPGTSNLTEEKIASLKKQGYDSMILYENGKIGEVVVFDKSQIKHIPKYAQSINLEKQKISPTAKQIELAVAGDKPIQTWAQTENLAKNIDKAVVLDKLKKGGGLNTAETHVIRQTNIDAVQELGNIIKSSTSDAELNAKILNYKDDIFKLASNAASEQGRSLNYYKKELGPTQIGNALGKLQKGLNPRQIKRLKEVVDSDFEPGKVKQFTSELDDPKLKDYVIEYWYNSILAGPPTHAVNVASNTAWSMYQVPHRVHVGLIDKIYSTFTGKARTRFVNETIPMMAGYKTGLKRGAKGAWEMIKTGEVADFETKWAQEVGLKNIAAWERSPHKWMRKVAPLVSMPTRALRAMDVWANSIAYDGEVNSIISRMATKKGLQGVARKTYETELKQNLPASIHDKAMKMAKHNTFMDDPDQLTAWFLKSREIPVIGVGSRFVVPFVNTIGNLTKRGLEFTPGVGIAKEVVSRAMGRGLGTPEIIAKQIEGSLLGLYVLSKLDKGEIIGEAPQSKSEREAMYRQGKKPWSIKLGDTWYQYRRAEPYNTAIASVAIAYNAIKNAKDDATATEIFGNMARGLVNNILDSSYFQGLQLVFNKYEKFKTAPPRMGASFVPYSSFWRSMNRAYEKATEGEAKVREKQGWLNAFAQVIPGLSGDIPAELNVWGEEKIIPGSIFQHWLPYKWVKESDDPVEKELKRLEVYPALPSNQYTVSGEKKTFSEDVYRNLCLDFGHRAKTLLGKHISKQSYQEAKETTIIDKRKLKNIDKILTRERNRARKKAIVKQMTIGTKPNVQ